MGKTANLDALNICHQAKKIQKIRGIIDADHFDRIHDDLHDIFLGKHMMKHG